MQTVITGVSGGFGRDGAIVGATNECIRCTGRPVSLVVAEVSSLRPLLPSRFLDAVGYPGKVDVVEY